MYKYVEIKQHSSKTNVLKKKSRNQKVYLRQMKIKTQVTKTLEKEVLRGKFIAINIYIREKNSSKHFNLYIKELERHTKHQKE